MGWAAAAQAFFKAVSGTHIDTSMAKGFSASGLGAFGAENDILAGRGSLFDLTNPVTLAVAAAVVVGAVYVFKKVV